MTVLLALLLGVARPPGAYIATPSGHVPLAISSWCWGQRCGAPIARSAKPAVFPRGATVKAELGFTPTKVSVAVVGRPVVASTHGREITWRATRSGGVFMRVTSARGWVIYVGRVKLR
jgi:hypothetical protein